MVLLLLVQFLVIFSQTLARPGEMPAKYFRLPSATHGGLSLQDQGSENNGETSEIVSGKQKKSGGRLLL